MHGRSQSRRPRALPVAQLLAGSVVLRRLARGRTRRPPLAALRARRDVAAGAAPDGADAAATVRAPRISAVIPARNEAARIGPCLTPLLADPDLLEVLVVDDGSRDGTAALAADLGARVEAAGEPPSGWVGKPWALQRGLELARGEIVVSLDADTRPQPGLALALAEALETGDLVSAGARFRCDTAGERWLHPALLTTLVYRYGPPDAVTSAGQDAHADPSTRSHRLLVNGQCTAVRRRALLAAGGYAAAAGHMTDDAAQARALAQRGWRVHFYDGGALLAVDMHDSAAETWREWGRSIALRDVTSAPWMLSDLAVVWLTLALPLPRLLMRTGTAVDRGLLALRMLITVALAANYAPRGAPYWLSPLADPLAAMRLTLSALRPSRRWRGREYGGAETALRSGS